MKGTGNNVVPTGGVTVVVTSRLGDIDFAGCRPGSECVVDWQHPDGGPEPVTHRHRGYDFNTTIFDGGAFEGVDPT